MRYQAIVLAMLPALLSSIDANAASLTVSPIMIEAGPAATASLTLRNGQDRPLNAQIRIFRWQQVSGEDRLVPDESVVASPPIVTIHPNEDYVVRLQRTADAPPSAEEAYRVVVDELPDLNRQRNGTVTVLLRYLVPAFFFPPDAGEPRVSWAVESRDGKPVLVGKNGGDKRLQIVDLKLKAGAKTRMLRKGLAGYVLGRSEKVWPLDATGVQGHGLSVVASSDHGPIDAPLSR